MVTVLTMSSGPLAYDQESFVQTSKCLSFYLYIYIYMDVVEWSRALDVGLSEWCCSVSMVWIQIPSREEPKIDSSKI